MSDKPARLQPLFLIKPGTMKRADIKRAERLCGICVVECSDTDAARYSDPPIPADLNQQSAASLSLLRWILEQGDNHPMYRGHLARIFADILVNGKKAVQTASVPRK